MKFEAEHNLFAAALAKAMTALENRNTIPILANFLIEAEGGKVSIVGSNLEMEVVSVFDANVVDGGSVTVRADLIKDLVNSFEKGSLITLDVKDEVAFIHCGKSKFKLKTLSPKEFPRMANDEYLTTFSASHNDMRNLLVPVMTSVSTEQTRYYLNGAYLHCVNGNACSVATDGHRLTKVESDIPADFQGVIVPIKTLKSLKDSLGDGEVTVHVSPTKIKFDLGGTVVISRVIDGTFPDYTRVIPEGGRNKASFTAKDAHTSIGRIAKIASDRTKSVALNIQEGELRINVSDPVNGEGEEFITAETDGAHCRIGINSKYALEALAQAEGGGATLEYGGPMDSMLIKYDEVPNMITVVMPVRT